jgi:hypothetical protein
MESEKKRRDRGKNDGIGMPTAAKWLGGLGLLPFICLSVAGTFLDGALRERAVFALAAYGATILSFLGGIHWGLSIGGTGSANNDCAMLRRLAVSVTPPLAAWVALLLSISASLLVLAAAIAVMLWVDIRAARAGDAPDWYPRLRWPLSCVAVAALLLAGL